jgi:hypothetical protein
VWLVEINAEFPELLLANMQTLTMVSLLALSDFRYNTRATKWAKNVFCAQIPLRAMLVLYSPESDDENSTRACLVNDTGRCDESVQGTRATA